MSPKSATCLRAKIPCALLLIDIDDFANFNKTYGRNAGDTGRRSSFRAYGGGPGLDYVFARFKPRLERELDAELSEQIFVANPAPAFALAAP